MRVTTIEILSSTPTPLKGITVDYEIQIPPVLECCASDSYSDSSSLDWLSEKEVDTHSNSNNKDSSSCEWEKKTSIEDYSDARKDLNLDMYPTDKTNPKCKSLPAKDVHPLDGLAVKSPS